VPRELREQVRTTVEDTKRRSGWPTTRTLAALGVSRSAYYAWQREDGPVAKPGRASSWRHPYEALPEERQAVLDYVRRQKVPVSKVPWSAAGVYLSHRELAWRMVDEGVACLSPSTVYRILKEAGLVRGWKTQERRKGEERPKAAAADERWQSDLLYVKIAGRNYFLIQFVDEYSRYITHHELMTRMDGDAVSLAAAAALEKLKACGSGRMPLIQTDNGSGYVSREFKIELGERGITHHRIYPHCPQQNGIVERTGRTLREQLEQIKLADLSEARAVIAEIIDWYNERRRHSSLHFLRPADYYRGQPEALLEARRVKLAQARHARRESNLKLRQRTLALEKSA
jgi:transposase InsO family protein